jgi:hypothetical protein
MVSPEKESQVMQEIGRRRSRTFSITLAISWPIFVVLLMFVAGLGLLIAGMIGGVLAAAFARVFRKSRTPAIIRGVLARHQIPPGALEPWKNIID